MSSGFSSGQWTPDEGGRVKRLLLATNNPHKLREYLEMFQGLPFHFTSLPEEGISQVAEEAGRTFRENAISKARVYAVLSGLLSLADDSGLEVQALGGEPGVLSSRYAGLGATDDERLRFLLEKMSNVPWERRAACFRCAIAIATPQGGLWVSEGECEGFVAFEPRGRYGFGYDPVFYLPEFALTMAELPPFVKNRVSHRAQAVQDARRILAELASSENLS